MENSPAKRNLILDITSEFALLAIEYCEKLEEQKRFVIANQLLKSATSIGANVFEAQNAESKIDFIHKLKIAAKEMEETKYWLYLCSKSKKYPPVDNLKEQILFIERILNKIIGTSKRRNEKSGFSD